MKFQHVNNDSMKITKYVGRTYVRDLVFSYLMKGVCRRNHPENETISCDCHTLRVTAQRASACVVRSLRRSYSKVVTQILERGEDVLNYFFSEAKHKSGFVEETVLQIATTRNCTKCRDYACLELIIRM
jgi:hypothetical protein